MDNFYDTAKRMYRSSKTLHDNEEYHNSCYLGGYVIECYVKFFVGMYSTRTPRSFSHHLSNLNIELQSILAGNSSLSPYILDGPVDFSSILSTWNPVNLRYIDTGSSLSNSTISTNFQSEINLAMRKLTQMRLDGYI